MTLMSTKTSTPSKPVTEGQIGKVQELLGAAMRKHASELPSETVQLIVSQEGDALQADLLAVVLKRVENRANTIVRVVPKLDRTRKPQEVLDATGRAQYTDKDVVATMPSNGTGVEENVTVEFFKLSRYVSDDELQRELDERGLTSDPYAQAAVNEADPAFADEHPNGTHWKNAAGKWCFASFNRYYGDERGVHVYRYGIGWRDDWWFAGVRKSR
jgi:hypothetical protein